jgi:hypothetical protein
MMLKKFLSRTVVVLCLAVSLLGQTAVTTSSSASAAGEAAIQRDIYLIGSPPTGSMASVGREIYLAAGWYGWDLSALNADGAGQSTTREIYLAAGTYIWWASVTATVQGEYSLSSDLGLKNGSADVAFLESTLYIIQSETYHLQSKLYQN